MVLVVRASGLGSERGPSDSCMRAHRLHVSMIIRWDLLAASCTGLHVQGG